MAACAGDELLVLAEDDDTYTAAAQPAPAKPGTCPAWSSSAKPERLLFVGWCVCGGGGTPCSTAAVHVLKYAASLSA